MSTLCVVGSHTIVPINWMCQKTIQFRTTESEIISRTEELRLDGAPALDLWDKRQFFSSRSFVACVHRQPSSEQDHH